MSKNARPITPVVQINMTEGERKSRVECAAGHHLLELYHLTDMVEGVLGVRVEDEPDAYLLKTYRTFFDEVCAPDFIKLRLEKESDQEIGRSLHYRRRALKFRPGGRMTWRKNDLERPRLF